MKSKTWKKVKSSTTWRPREGDELVGIYGGRVTKNGNFGFYEIMIVHTSNGTFLITGSALIDLLNASELVVNQPCKIIFKGLENWIDSNGKKCKKKLFELYV